MTLFGCAVLHHNNFAYIIMMEKIGYLAGMITLALILSGCSGGRTPTRAVIVDSEETETTITSETESSFVMEVTTEESSPEETTEETLYIPEEYYEVIDSIVDCIDNFDPGGINSYYGNEYGGGVCELCSYDDPKSMVGYAFADIDGDKTAELLILDIGTSEYENRIIELYTFADGVVEHVLSGGYRSRNYIAVDMTLYIEGSSGASYSIVTRNLFDKDTHTTVFIDSYYTVPVNIGENDEGIKVCYTTDKESILSEDFDSDNVEVIETVTGSSNIYEKYGVRTVGLYDYGTIPTLSEYCEMKNG